MNAIQLMSVSMMKDREKWLEMRRTGIGGSDAAIVAGLNPWRSVYDLWLEKTGQKAPEDLSDNEAVHFGVLLEGVVADEFCKRTGKRVRRQGMVRSAVYPFAIADIDRDIVGEDAGLECKTAGAWKRKEWEHGAIPPAYYCQIQHYMMVTGAAAWYVAVLFGGQRFEWRRIERSEEDIKALAAMEADFWKHVESGEPPSIDGSDACKAALQAKYPPAPESLCEELPQEAAALLADYDTYKAAEKAAKTGRQAAENKLCALLGTNIMGTVGDRVIVWQPRAGRVTIDAKRLKEERPDIYNQYAKQGKEYRVFTAPM